MLLIEVDELLQLLFDAVFATLSQRFEEGVVGIAGGPEKCAYAVRELGYDACVDHKSASFADDMKAALPKGLDGLFENVGGEPFHQCLRNINDFSRVAICGLIASYEGAPTILPDMRLFLVRRFKMEGFIVGDHLDLWPKAIGELAGHIAAKRLTCSQSGPGRAPSRCGNASSSGGGNDSPAINSASAQLSLRPR